MDSHPATTYTVGCTPSWTSELSPRHSTAPQQVFVVCISAMCRLDYATQVTDIGAELINEWHGVGNFDGG